MFLSVENLDDIFLGRQVFCSRELFFRVWELLNGKSVACVLETV